MTLPAGTRVGPYDIVAKFGEGGPPPLAWMSICEQEGATVGPRVNSVGMFFMTLTPDAQHLTFKVRTQESNLWLLGGIQ